MDFKEHLKQALKELGFGAETPPRTPPQEPVQDERLAALEAENARLQEQLSAQAEQVQAQAEANAQLERAARTERLERRVEDLRQSFRLTPAAADLALALATDNPDALELCLPVMEANAPNAHIGGGVDGQGLREDGNNAADVDRLHNLTVAYAKEHRLSYGAAMAAVSREHPDLATSALTTTAPPLEAES